MKISKCDNSLMTAQKQTIIVGANSIRPKQRLGRMQYTPTVKKEGKKEKNIKNGVTFVTFVTFQGVNASETEQIRQ